MVIFPNAENLSGDFMTTDRDGGIFGAKRDDGLLKRVFRQIGRKLALKKEMLDLITVMVLRPRV